MKDFTHSSKNRLDDIRERDDQKIERLERTVRDLEDEVKKLRSIVKAYERTSDSPLYNTAFKRACQYGDLETVKVLLSDKRVDPGDCNNESIRVASQNGHLEIVKLLLQDKRVNPSDQSEIVKLLEDAGCKLDP